MTLIERFVGYDAWTTRQLMLRAKELDDERLDRVFPLWNRSLRGTILHQLEVMEWHTDFLCEATNIGDHHSETSIGRLLRRHEVVADRFRVAALQVEAKGNADDILVNPRNGRKRTRGALVIHILSHNSHHRAQVLAMLEELGVEDVIEGDALGWEAIATGQSWADGVSYGQPM